MTVLIISDRAIAIPLDQIFLLPMSRCSPFALGTKDQDSSRPEHGEWQELTLRCSWFRRRRLGAGRLEVLRPEFTLRPVDLAIVETCVERQGGQRQNDATGQGDEQVTH